MSVIRKPRSARRIDPRTISAVFHTTCGYDVKKDFFKRALMGTSMIAMLALTGCGTPAAKDFGGRWKPANRFQDAPTEIPLAKTYTYYASPMDGTLKTMLTRWAKDSGMQLSYDLPADYTLYKPVSQIRTTDLQSAASELSSIYGAQGVSVSADNRRIVVQPVGQASADAAVPSATSGAGASAPASAK